MAFSLSVHIYNTQQTILDIQYCGAEAARPKFFFWLEPEPSRNGLDFDEITQKSTAPVRY